MKRGKGRNGGYREWGRTGTEREARDWNGGIGEKRRDGW